MLYRNIVEKVDSSRILVGSSQELFRIAFFKAFGIRGTTLYGTSQGCTHIVLVVYLILLGRTMMSIRTLRA